VAVYIRTQGVIHQHAGAEKPLAALAFAIRGNDEGQGSDQMRRNSQEDGALEARGPQAPYVGMLHVADATMHDLETMRGRAG
jgi:hypothetical protein